MVKMYRKHGENFVVDVDQVWPIIPVNDPDYQAWLTEENVPLEQDEVEAQAA
jgi:hypothetical protein